MNNDQKWRKILRDITDDFTRYGYVYLMKHTHETFEMFKQHQNEVQNQLVKTIKMLRSDRGGEYLSLDFDEHLMKCGIISHLTPPGMPQLNGVSKWRNRTLLDMVQSMMCRTNLPHSFWNFALETATRIINLAPTKKVDKMSYEIWHRVKPKVATFLEKELLARGIGDNRVDMDEIQEPQSEPAIQHETVETES
ncbi:hypothetical protein L1987_54502 [Smallanthus sonchifolius]|uniref:Uncharacterized protein n=1 Tax=Smallanthus sonchifolius TaxID=185202 RepID=A0ACB9E7Z7_9ASTR|nr:hypothetical protein L1987_54502 [Smallanthus sonchifolius]